MGMITQKHIIWIRSQFGEKYNTALPSSLYYWRNYCILEKVEPLSKFSQLASAGEYTPALESLSFDSLTSG